MAFSDFSLFFGSRGWGEVGGSMVNLGNTLRHMLDWDSRDLDYSENISLAKRKYSKSKESIHKKHIRFHLYFSVIHSSKCCDTRKKPYNINNALSLKNKNKTNKKQKNECNSKQFNFPLHRTLTKPNQTKTHKTPANFSTDHQQLTFYFRFSSNGRTENKSQAYSPCMTYSLTINGGRMVSTKTYLSQYCSGVSQIHSQTEQGNSKA